MPYLIQHDGRHFIGNRQAYEWFSKKRLLPEEVNSVHLNPTPDILEIRLRKIVLEEEQENPK